MLLTLANLYRMYDNDSIETDVREHMLARLEFRWKKAAGQDQRLFILAVFLNPYLRGHCFNREVLAPADIIAIARDVFARFFDCEPDTEFTAALIDYSNGLAEFSDENLQLDYHKQQAEQRQSEVSFVIFVHIDWQG